MLYSCTHMETVGIKDNWHNTKQDNDEKDSIVLLQHATCVNVLRFASSQHVVGLLLCCSLDGDKRAVSRRHFALCSACGSANCARLWTVDWRYHAMCLIISYPGSHQYCFCRTTKRLLGPVWLLTNSYKLLLDINI